VFPYLSRYAVGVAFLIALLAWIPSAPAQPEKKPADPDAEAEKALLDKAREEYRLFFKEPKEVVEFWAAITFEIEVGKFDLAALHLNKLVKKEPFDKVDQELVKIEDLQGYSAFLRLRNVRHWHDNAKIDTETKKSVETLIERVTTAVEKKLSDPVLIKKYVNNLAAEKELRAYAIARLIRSGPRAIPQLITEFRSTPDEAVHKRILSVLMLMDQGIFPPLLGYLEASNAKDAKEEPLRLAILQLIRKRDERSAIPTLWSLTTADKYPLAVRTAARETQASLLRISPDKLPLAKVELTRLAERYYKHQVKLAATGTTLWHWDGKDISKKTYTPAQAEEYLARHYARLALELDPAYKDAQIIFLSQEIRSAYGAEVDQEFAKKAPELFKALVTSNTDLLVSILERGMVERQIPVILATVQALGARADVRAAKVSGSGPPRGLSKALFYPDRRVQFAAARAILRVPVAPAPVISTRVVEILRRAIAAEPGPRVLIGYRDENRKGEVFQLLKEAKIEPVVVRTPKETCEELKKGADIDALVIDHAFAGSELVFFLTQLRADVNVGHLPLLLTAPLDKQEDLETLTARFPNVWVVPEIITVALSKLPKELQKEFEGALRKELQKRIRDATLAPLSDKERDRDARLAMDYLWDIARGDLKGYSITLAQGAVLRALDRKELSDRAIEIAGRLPGVEPQQRLLALVLDKSRDKQRYRAADELNRHIQQNGMMLTPEQLQKLRQAYQNTAEDPALRERLALIIGNLQPGASKVGVGLLKLPPPKK
jgi:hypothetical protein